MYARCLGMCSCTIKSLFGKNSAPNGALLGAESRELLLKLHEVDQ